MNQAKIDLRRKYRIEWVKRKLIKDPDYFAKSRRAWRKSNPKRAEELRLRAYAKWKARHLHRPNRPKHRTECVECSITRESREPGAIQWVRLNGHLGICPNCRPVSAIRRQVADAGVALHTISECAGLSSPAVVSQSLAVPLRRSVEFWENIQRSVASKAGRWIDILSVVTGRGSEDAMDRAELAPLSEVLEIEDGRECSRDLDGGLHDKVWLAFDLLTRREQKILRLRYGLDGQGARTLEEIGRAHRVSRERVRQILSKSFRIIKRKVVWLTMAENKVRITNPTPCNHSAQPNDGASRT